MLLYKMAWYSQFSISMGSASVDSTNGGLKFVESVDAEPVDLEGQLHGVL